MSNRKMNLSAEGKHILDELTEQLGMDRPFVLQLALAKGIQISNGIPEPLEEKEKRKKWTIPDNIIKEDNFTLFKFIIQNEAKKPITNDELHDYMLLYLELGLRDFSNINREKTSMEDLRLAIL